jgi:hypothetical protein
MLRPILFLCVVVLMVPCVAYSSTDLVSVADGRLIAPDGVPAYPDPSCLEEMQASGPGWWWDYVCQVQGRGIAEFDLEAIAPESYASVFLILEDTGGATQLDSFTDIYGYSADGQLTLQDWGREATYLLTIQRPWLGGPTTHDVTAFVNAHITDPFIGFRMQTMDSLSVDAFGLHARLSFSSASSVPSIGVSSELRLAAFASPNPITGGTTITYNLDGDRAVDFVLSDTQGRVVFTDVFPRFGRGPQAAYWNGRNANGAALPPGHYFISLRSGAGVATTRVLILR